MSLYNALMGSNPLTMVFLEIVGLKLEQIGRMRDTYLIKDGDKIQLGVFTRNGGNNRELMDIEIKQMQKHPNYVRDFDDEFDSTFATFVFNMDMDADLIETLLVAADAHDMFTHPMTKYRSLMDRMKSSPDDPDVKKALEVGKKVVESVMGMLNTDGTVKAAYINPDGTVDVGPLPKK